MSACTIWRRALGLLRDNLVLLILVTALVLDSLAMLRLSRHVSDLTVRVAALYEAEAEAGEVNPFVDEHAFAEGEL